MARGFGRHLGSELRRELRLGIPSILLQTQFGVATATQEWLISPSLPSPASAPASQRERAGFTIPGLARRFNLV